MLTNLDGVEALDRARHEPHPHVLAIHLHDAHLCQESAGRQPRRSVRVAGKGREGMHAHPLVWGRPEC